MKQNKINKLAALVILIILTLKLILFTNPLNKQIATVKPAYPKIINQVNQLLNQHQQRTLTVRLLHNKYRLQAEQLIRNYFSYFNLTNLFINTNSISPFLFFELFYFTVGLYFLINKKKLLPFVFLLFAPLPSLLGINLLNILILFPISLIIYHGIKYLIKLGFEYKKQCGWIVLSIIVLTYLWSAIYLIDQYINHL